jgi:D-serine dehydratase
LRVSDIAHLTLAPGTKGLPLDGSIRRVGDLTGRGLNLLRGDLPMPVAVLKRAALENNLRVMQEYIGRAGIKLAPHAKTTMCPQLFERQLEHGCWGLSVATMTQLKLCHDLGVERLILANQLVGRAEINALGCLQAQAPERAYYVLVDGFSGAQAISEGFRHCAGSPPARLLIEIGIPQGRCGVRTVDEGLVLARAIRTLPHVELHGIAGYEGLIVSDHAGKDAAAVADYLTTLVRLYNAVASEDLFQNPEQVIISAGGSAYYDLVAQVVAAGSRGVVPILRSGCYLTHDGGFYERLLTRIEDRAVAGPAPHLMPALEVWSRVISRPEPNQAIVMMGKRDVSYDIDLPVPRLWYREGWHDVPQPVDGWTVYKLNDQHGYLTVPPQARLAVGDLLGFDISHPCTTFDKWSLLLEVDESYTVLGGLKTFF